MMPDSTPKSHRDICPAHIDVPLFESRPSRTPIYPAAVYQCESPAQANARLGGDEPGYVYQRDGHPNADVLAEKCRQLHDAKSAWVTSSGMAAISLAMLSCLKTGDHLVISNRLYGRTRLLTTSEAGRLGIESTVVDMNDLEKFQAAMNERTRLVVVETISNPMLRLAKLQRIAEITHEWHARLMVDNTFASPIVCQPLKLGADIVVESVSKIMNGHGDLMMGLLCLHPNTSDDMVRQCKSTLATWGFASSPFDCWLAERGLGTLYTRMTTCCATASWLANHLVTVPGIEQVHYPGLADHPDHFLAQEQFASLPNLAQKANPDVLYGNMLSISLSGGLEQVTRWMKRTRNLPFCPSLGELMTTVSHPATTSHRGLSQPEQLDLGIKPGTIRFSIGLENPEYLLAAIKSGL